MPDFSGHAPTFTVRRANVIKPHPFYADRVAVKYQTKNESGFLAVDITGNFVLGSAATADFRTAWIDGKDRLHMIDPNYPAAFTVLVADV